MYIDLTHNFTSQMPVFPGDTPPELVKLSDAAKDGFTHFQIKTAMHVGTHIDAASHAIPGGKDLHQYPVEKFFGRGVIIDARDKTSASTDLLSNVKISKDDIVLVCFGWSKKFRDAGYCQNYPVLEEDFAQKLVTMGASIVGTDTPSPDSEPYKIHQILLSNDILIIENLNNLEQLLGRENFQITALPPKFETEAAPCRVVAKI